MRRGTWLVVGVGLLVAAGAVAACVGDTPTTNGTPGEEGQPCFSNGTCNAGLACLSKVCVRVDGGGADSGGTPDSGATKDAGPDGPPAPCPFQGSASTATTVDCTPETCTLNSGMPACCEQGAGTTCSDGTVGTCPSPSVLWHCDDPSQCGGQSCCAYVPPPPMTPDCPKTIDVQGPAKANCAATCTGIELCADDVDCTDIAKHCVEVEVDVGTAAKTVGMCL